MGDVQLYFTNACVSVGHDVDVERFQSPKTTRDFASVELGVKRHSREKTPRRIIHFSNGETIEEYSTDEEAQDKEPERKDLLSSSSDASKMTWGPYFLFHMWRAATSTLSACDYLGEKMASLFGITSAKYQYAIDEYYKIKKEEKKNRLSEEAEHPFDQSHSAGDGPIARTELPSASPDITYQIQNEIEAPSGARVGPAIVAAN
ncbi:protein FAM177A1-like isoform X2 [Syngnathoides biaculeatus]|uniref:protein FAM177A1-like isoform X2 n=1 Tax=Syngnathoides biaculeatus TaxID=300417 RepID=UPI002ADD6E0E|nr:protein FAM177A1-like isoform X2 [Syngnathoides biaculeatus]